MAKQSLLTLLLSTQLATCSVWWNRRAPVSDLPELGPTSHPKLIPRYGTNATTPILVPPPATFSPAPTLVPPPATLTSVAQADCTVVISQAGLDWWYSQTYVYAYLTYQILVTEPTNGLTPYGTAYTLISTNPSPINATASLLTPTNRLVATIGTINGTLTPITTLSPEATPTPVAPFTTVHTRSSVNPLPTYGTFDNPNGTYGINIPPSALKTLGPVQTTLAEAESSSTPTTITSATPFLRFTDYQIISLSTRANVTGSVEIETVTSVYNLTSPIGYALAGSTNLDGVLSASGTIPPDFTNALGVRSSCVLSSWYAQPTVIVVIQIVYGVQAVLAARTEISQSQLDIPSSGFPDSGPGASQAPPNGQIPLNCIGAQCTITYNTGHIESPQSTLDVPSSFVIPGPTELQPLPSSTSLNDVPRRQQTIDGVSLAPSTPAPALPTTSSLVPAVDSAQALSEFSAIVSVLSRLGSLTSEADAASTASPVSSEQASPAAQGTPVDEPSGRYSPTLSSTPGVTLSTASSGGSGTVSASFNGAMGDGSGGQGGTLPSASSNVVNSQSLASTEATSTNAPAETLSPSATGADQATGLSSSLQVRSSAVLLALAIMFPILF